jgi:hypothetical protein
LRLVFHKGESALFAFVAGSACLSLLAFVLCLVHQARWTVFLALGAGSLAWAIREAGNDAPAAGLPAIPRAWRAVFVVVFTAFFICYFFNALAPEVSPDGNSYHLGNVARYWRHQGFTWDYHSIYASLAQGMEMLFLVAFCFGRHPAAAMVHLAFQAALPLLLVCYGRRFGAPRVGIFAAVLVYACPIAGITGISAYNDLTVATLLFAGFYLIKVQQEETSYNILFLIGLFSGFSYATKYDAGLALLVAMVLTWGQPRFRRLLPLMLGAAVAAGPWILRNWIWLGNPAAPFLNSWFPNPYWTTLAEHQHLAGLRQFPSFKSYWDLILQVTVLGGFVPGMLGPACLLLPLALLTLRGPSGRRLLAVGLLYAFPVFLNADLRFVIPGLPFLFLALGHAMENSWGVLPAVALVQAVLCWPAVMDTYCDPNAWRVRGFQTRAALRLEPESAFIARHVSDYALRSAIAQSVPPDRRIFSFGARAAAYLDRDIVVGYESSQGLVVQQALQIAAAAGSGQHAAALVARSEGLDYLLVSDDDGVAENMKNNLNLWGLTKLAEANGTTLYRID